MDDQSRNLNPDSEQSRHSGEVHGGHDGPSWKSRSEQTDVDDVSVLTVER